MSDAQEKPTPWYAWVMVMASPLVNLAGTAWLILVIVRFVRYLWPYGHAKAVLAIVPCFPLTFLLLPAHRIFHEGDWSFAWLAWGGAMLWPALVYGLIIVLMAIDGAYRRLTGRPAAG